MMDGQEKENTQLLRPNAIKIEADEILRKIEKILEKPFRLEISINGKLDDLPLDKLENALTRANLKIDIRADDQPIKRVESIASNASQTIIVIVVVWAVASLIMRLIR